MKRNYNKYKDETVQMIYDLEYVNHKEIIELLYN